jgi:hypothetical protein
MVRSNTVAVAAVVVVVEEEDIAEAFVILVKEHGLLLKSLLIPLVLIKELNFLILFYSKN